MPAETQAEEFSVSMDERSVLEDVFADFRENFIALFKLLLFYVKQFKFLRIFTLVLGIFFVAWGVFSLILHMKKVRHQKRDFADCSKVVLEELKDGKPLLEQCMHLGILIDRHTNRKNNSRLVAPLVYRIARFLDVSQKDAALYFCAALVYDAGFLNINGDLFRMEILSAREKKRIKTHVLSSIEHFDFVDKAYFSLFYEASNFHHENADGSGYPEGLVQNDIPLIARILHVAESFVSLTNRRTYHKSLSKKAAMQNLVQKKGIYDKQIVDALCKSLGIRN